MTGTMPATTDSYRVDVASLAILIGTAAVIGISNGIFAPVISLKAEAAGISPTWNGILAGAPALAILVLGPAFPIVLRRIGVLSSFYSGTALAVIAIGLFPNFDNYWVWLLLRFTMGGALGLQWVVSESWINGLASGPRRGTILGIYVAIYSAGLAIGPVVITYTGSQGFQPFLLGASLLMLCGIALPFARPAKSAETPATSKPLSWTMRIATTEYIAGFVHGARYASSFALLPLYTIHLGSDPGRSLTFLTAICVGSVIFQPVSGRLIDRFSPRSVLLTCAFLQVISCLILAPAVSSTVWVWPLMLIWGASGGAMYTACVTSLGKKFTTHDIPAATTGFLMAWECGALLGPLVAGAAMDAWDPHGMALILGLFGVLLLVVSGGRDPTIRSG